MQVSKWLRVALCAVAFAAVLSARHLKRRPSPDMRPAPLALPRVWAEHALPAAMHSPPPAAVLSPPAAVLSPPAVVQSPSVTVESPSAAEQRTRAPTAAPAAAASYRPPQHPLADAPLAGASARRPARRKLRRGASIYRRDPLCKPREALLASRRKHPDGYVLVLGANTGTGVAVDAGGHGEPELWWNETLFGRTYRKVLVEPVPPVFAELYRKMATNGPPNISLVKAAIGTQAGSTVTMHCWAEVERYPAFVGQLCSTSVSRLADGAWSLRYLRNLAEVAEKGQPQENRTIEVPPAARRLLSSARGSKFRSRPNAGKAKLAVALTKIAADRDKTAHLHKNRRVRYTVAAMTVEELLTRMRVPLGAVRYVQIDVEGADLAVLQSMPWNGTSFRPSAVMWEQRNLDPRDRTRAYALLQRHGYRVCPVCEEHGGLALGADPLGKCNLEFATDVFAMQRTQTPVVARDPAADDGSEGEHS
eukprot:TRINITY_DN4949_c0_g1_i2.p1 TRINITY_DN4949_c0_g1~~TRINITY_DN4949_c0_g1_i2.p1  ORF type:complete len:477 (+),score=60.33 TRINITY_DN4949_c0_g1_i2:71-1501(+)